MPSAVDPEVGQIEFDRHDHRTLRAPLSLKEAGAGAMLVACRLAGLSAQRPTMPLAAAARNADKFVG